MAIRDLCHSRKGHLLETIKKRGIQASCWPDGCGCRHQHGICGCYLQFPGVEEKRSDIIILEVVSENIVVYDSNRKQGESQLLPIVNDSIDLRTYYTTTYTGKSPSSTPKYSLAFRAFVPPLGFSTYVIASTKKLASNSVNDEFTSIVE